MFIKNISGQTLSINNGYGVQTVANQGIIPILPEFFWETEERFNPNWQLASVADIGGSSSLPTYIITVPNIGVNGDGSAFTVYGGALVYMSNGQMMFDVPNPLPLLSTINQPVQSGFVRPIALWATVSSGTPTYFWTWGDEFDPQFLAPPVFFNNAPAGATMLINGIVSNDTVGTLTIGVDNLTGDFGFNPFRLNGEESIVSNNPAFYYDSGSDSIEIKNDFSISGETFNPGDSLEDDFMQGYVLPAGEGDVWGIGYAGLFNYNLYLFPLSTGVPQGMTLLARVDVNNASPGPWTWGDSLGAVVDSIRMFSDSAYLGSWTDEAELTAGLIIPAEGNIMKSAVPAEGIQIYINGAWVPLGGGGSPNTITATAGYDFSRFGTAVIPVQMVAGSVLPINTPFFPTQRTVSGGQVVTQVKQVAMNPQKVVLINTNDSGDIWCRVLKYDIDTGELNTGGTAGQFAAGFVVDTTIPIHATKVSYDKVAVSYTDTSGNGRIVLLQITADYFSEIRDTTVIATDCGEIKVVEGDWNAGGSGETGDLYGISFVFGNKTDNTFYAGGITVDNNRQYDTVTINQIDNGGSPIPYTAGDVWGADGCGYRNNTTGCFLFIDTDAFYFDLISGTVGATNLGAAIGPASDIVVKNISGTTGRWAIGFIFSTYEVRWATANFDGVNLNIGPFQLVLGVNFDRITTRGTLDINPDELTFTCHFTTIIQDGVQTQVEQTIMDMTAYVSSNTVLDTQIINIDPQNTTYRSISSVFLRRQDMTATYNELQLSFVFINDLANIVSYQIGYGYVASLGGFYINLGTFLAVPQFDKCTGVITNANVVIPGDSVTVYCKGSEAPRSTPLQPGDSFYLSRTGILAATSVSELKIGTVHTSSRVYIDLEPVIPLSYSQNDSNLDASLPYGTIILNGNQVQIGDAGALSPHWFAPITFVSNQLNSNVIIENINGTENFGMINPSLIQGDSYIPFGLPGDKITIQRDRDMAWVCYNVLNEDSEGLAIDYPMDTSTVFGSNIMAVPYIYSNTRKVNFITAGNITVHTINGFPIGRTIRFTNTSPSNVTIQFQSGGVGNIIGGGRRNELVLATFDSITLRVNTDYTLSVVEVFKNGGEFDLNTPDTVQVAVSSAEVLQLNTAPKQLLPAPGINKIYQIYKIMARLNYNTTPYATHTNMGVVYNANTYADAVYQNTQLLQETATQIQLFEDNEGVIETNQPLNLMVNSGDPTAGDSSIDVYITYKILSL